MTTGTQSAELVEAARYMGRCRTRGCSYRAVVDAEVRPYTYEGRVLTSDVIRLLPEDLCEYTVERRAETAAIIAANGYPPQRDPTLTMPDGRSWTRFRLDLYGDVRRALIRVGLWCPHCDDEIKVTRLTAKRNDGKTCSRICMQAISSSCECSCGGSNHGRGWMPGSVRIEA